MPDRDFLKTPEDKLGLNYGYVVLVASFIIMSVAVMGMGIYSIFFKPMSVEFGWTRSVTSGPYTLAFLMFGTLSAVTGRLTDKFGPRSVVTICGLVFGLGIFLMSRVDSIWLLYIYWGLLVGIGRSGNMVPPLSTIARWFHKRRGIMTGIAMAGVGVGNLIIPPVATRLIEAYGWRDAFVILAVVTVVIMVLAAQFLRRPRAAVARAGPDLSPMPGATPPDISGLSLQETLRNRQFWLLSSFYLIHMMITQAIMVHLVPHITDLGISAVTAATILAISGGMSSVGRVVNGAVSDGAGTRVAMITVGVTTFIAFLGLGMVEEVWLFYLFGVIYGFCWGSGAATMSPLIAQNFGLRAHGTIMGIMIMLSTIGGACGPLMAGGLFDATGNYTMTFIILDVLAGVVLLLSFFIRGQRATVLRSVG
ncbi:MFS transporter [Chloroflexota bacterium]